jgi:hypothetical protein
MKIIIAALFLIIVITGCSKTRDILPVNPGNGVASKKPADTTVIRMSADDSIHLAAFKVNPQKVKISISGKNLIMKFDENIDLLISPDGYGKTSAVHLHEDFKNSLLAGFEFTTVAEQGNTTLNWVDDNLNNVILKSVGDTIINNNRMIKINVHRTFTFFKIYENDQLAINEQNILLSKKDDQIIFTSYSYYNQKNYPKTSVAAFVEYQK